MTEPAEPPPALRGATAALVSDALDELGVREHTLAPDLRPLAPGMTLIGRAVPVEVAATDVIPEEPYRGEMAVVDSLRPGEVPVYAVTPGVGAALWGELFSCAAIGRGAAGVVVDGPVRDVVLTRELGFPVFARGASPLDTRGRAEVVGFREPVACAGVIVRPGDVVVADEDGVVVCPAELEEDVAASIAAKARHEGGARADLRAGALLHEVWERWRAL